VRLINCCLAEASEVSLKDSIELKLEPSLALTGVDVFALVHADRCRQGFDPGDFRTQPLGGRFFEPPVRRTDLEALLLGGRPNAITEGTQDSNDVKNYASWWNSWLGPDGVDSLPDYTSDFEDDDLDEHGEWEPDSDERDYIIYGPPLL
jgi:hypothetical protein